MEKPASVVEISMKDIVVVIVNYNMKSQVESCLASLFPEIRQSTLEVSVVVVDNASGDGMGDFLKEKYPEVLYVYLPENTGFGNAQNIGMKHTEARYYFVLNPDTEFSKNSRVLEQLFQYMELHSYVGIAGPKLLNQDGSLQYSCWRFPTFWQPAFSRTQLGDRGKGKKISHKYFMKDFDHKSTRPVDALMGSAMFVRARAAADVGYFDTQFWMYFEDTDWCLRMWEKGWAVVYVHDSVVTHIHRRDSARIPGIFNSIFRNKLTRVHVASWIRFMKKWHTTLRFYRASK